MADEERAALRVVADTADGPAAEAEEHTIDELGRVTGMTVRTIRAHQARGLLPPPEVRDRVGYYGPEHVARLRLIQELQGEGFNLRGIKRLLDATGGPTQQLLGFGEAVRAPFAAEEPQALTRDELVERFGADRAGELLARAERAGTLVPLGGDRYEAPVPSLLDIAEQAVASGVDLPSAVAAMDKVTERCEAIARSFVALYLDQVWKPFAEAGYPEDRWPEVMGSIEALRPLAAKAVQGAFELAMTRAVDTAFGEELGKIAKGRRQR
ncbi:MAG: MerR family transcriptional regulator [Solirubrobacterales bacterium]|nr:MerR family transcriptional regulator [Solirubrobacterales bacterium]